MFRVQRRTLVAELAGAIVLVGSVGAPPAAVARVDPELTRSQPASPPPASSAWPRRSQDLASAAEPSAESPDPAQFYGRGVWPLSPTPSVARGFEPPSVDWEAGHRGVDLGGTPGQPVLSSLAGTVRFAGRIAGKGVVVIEHAGTRTTYEPVAAVVKRGSTVSAGELIGRLEVTSSHCFPVACLHWGWRDDHQYWDPLLLVGLRPRVRLLPLWQEEPAAG